MTKELVTIEFRYLDAPKSDLVGPHKSKKITIGVYDTLDEAMNAGNKALEVLEDYFKLNTAYNKKERFSKNGGCFGYPNRLITNLGYLQTPFEFYASITKLSYDDLDQTILDVVEAGKRYKEFKNSNQDE